MQGSRASTVTQESIHASALPDAIVIDTGRTWGHLHLSIDGGAGTGLLIVGVRVMMSGG